ncbi:hypothetical protein [Eubacterium sp.]
MADGSIRIGIEFDKSKAKKGTNDLVKETENVIKGLEKITKNMTISYDTEGAKKQLKSLDKVITDNQKNIENAKKAFQKNVESEIKALEKEAESYVKPLSEADSEFEKQQQTVAKLEERLTRVKKIASYGDNSSAIEQAKQLTAELEEAKRKEQELLEKSASLGEKFEYAKNKAAELKVNPSASASQDELTTKVKTYENVISDAKDEQKDIYKGLNKAKTHATRLATAMTGAKKVTSGMKTAVVTVTKGAGKLVKTVGKSLTNGIKKGVSKFKDMGNSVESVRKKTLKIGLALIGMRGALGMLRKAVSSALSDNEELQNQLNAIKGMMGQALAPAIQVLLNGLSQLITFADKLYQVFFKTSLIAKYNAKQTEKTAKSTKKASKSAKDYNRQMAAFDVANALSGDSNSDKASDEAEEIANLFKPAKMKKWMQDIIKAFKKGDWKDVGATIAKSINNALAKINWKGIQNKVKKFTTALAEAMNGFVEFLDWNLLGNSFAEALNTITTAITNFVDTVDWNMLGGKISDGLNSLVDRIDAEKLGKTLSSHLKIITNTLYGFFNGEDGNGGFNFANLGNKIGATVNAWFANVDWKKIGSNISNAISGIGETISGFADTLSESQISDKINDFFAGFDSEKIRDKATTAINNLISSLKDTINGIDAEAIGEDFANLIGGLADIDWSGTITLLVDALKKVADVVIDTLWDMILNGDTYDLGSQIADALCAIDWLGILEKVLEVIGAVALGLTDILYGFCDNIAERIIEWSEGIDQQVDDWFSSIGDNIKNWWNSKGKTWLKDNIVEPFRDRLKKELSKIKDLGVEIKMTAKDMFTGTLNALIRGLNKIIDTLKNIDVFGVQPFSWMNNIPQLAKGGIVNNPGRGVTATVGEAGAEAVLPLENNTDWMDALAERLASKIGAGDTTVVLKLDSKTLSKEVIKATNRRAYLTGGRA